MSHDLNMDGSEAPPREVAAFCQRLAGSVAARSGARLVGAYLHGSAAWGGWVASRSDVDLLFVLDASATAEDLSAVERALVDSAEHCPGTGLECSVVTTAQARTPTAPRPFLLHVQASHGEPVKSIFGDTLDGDPDLLMHYTVCRAAGVAVIGPEPRAVFGSVHRELVLGYLADELRWGIEHGSEAYAVLNACRALIYMTQDDVVSKLEGGCRILNEPWAPHGVVARSLEQQQGVRPPQPLASDAAGFVQLAIDRLQSQS